MSEVSLPQARCEWGRIEDRAEGDPNSSPVSRAVDVLAFMFLSVSYDQLPHIVRRLTVGKLCFVSIHISETELSVEIEQMQRLVTCAVNKVSIPVGERCRHFQLSLQ